MVAFSSNPKNLLIFENVLGTRDNVARKPGDENPFAESYLFDKFVDDGFSKTL